MRRNYLIRRYLKVWVILEHEMLSGKSAYEIAREGKIKSPRTHRAYTAPGIYAALVSLEKYRAAAAVVKNSDETKPV